MKSPQDVASKWARNLGSSTESIKQGVQSVTRNPAEAALARTDAYVNGVQRAVAEGRFQRGLRRVTLSSWQDAMLTKGLPRVASGAAAAKTKVEAHMSKWLPHMEAGKQKLASMPRGDLQQNIARMVAFVQHASEFKGT